MRAILQRVSGASVEISEEITARIGFGWLVLLGVGPHDLQKDLDYILDKTLNLRAFEDKSQKMNLSILDIKGEVLVVSQFTLYGDCRKGRRPSFSKAAPPELAENIYNDYVDKLKESGLIIKTGQFGSHMKVSLCNDGPVTLILDSKVDTI